MKRRNKALDNILWFDRMSIEKPISLASKIVIQNKDNILLSKTNSNWSLPGWKVGYDESFGNSARNNYPASLVPNLKLVGLKQRNLKGNALKDELVVFIHGKCDAKSHLSDPEAKWFCPDKIIDLINQGQIEKSSAEFLNKYINEPQSIHVDLSEEIS